MYIQCTTPLPPKKKKHGALGFSGIFHPKNTRRIQAHEVEPLVHFLNFLQMGIFGDSELGNPSFF